MPKKTTTLATREQSLVSYTPEQIELIKNTVAKGSTNDELQLFMAVAKRSGLDPFTKQIHFVKRRTFNARTRQYEDMVAIQTGIDGYRAIAERSGSLAGIDDAVYDSETEQHPNKASVTVYRFLGGERVPFTASARWTEYAQQGKDGYTRTWKNMPYLMLAKCAEALALRKAFPNDLSGLYTNEEMAQADNEPVKIEAKPVAKVDAAPEEKRVTIMKLVEQLKPGLEKDAVVQFIVDETTLFPNPSTYDKIIADLQQKVADREDTGEDYARDELDADKDDTINLE